MTFIEVLFAIFVILGGLFYVYLVAVHFINKKREQLIKAMEEAFARKKFVKCPSCSVLNRIGARFCEFCKKPLPAPPEKPSEEIPGVPSVESVEKSADETPEQLVPQPVAPLPSPKPWIESFPFHRTWPTPSTTALISITSAYVFIIVVFLVFSEIYNVTKEGVIELRDVSKGMAKRRAPIVSSQPIPPPTSTPTPSPTPFSVTGTREEQITKLMLLLESEDWNVANEAKKRLIEMGKLAALALAKEINHPDEMMRTHVITALGQMRIPETAPALIGALKHPDPITATQSATALGNIEAQEVVGALIGALKHPDWRVRLGAVEALGKQGDPKALPAILTLREDANERIRQAALKAIAILQKKD